MQVKYFTKDALQEANKEAINSKRNRSIDPKVFEWLEAGNLYPVAWNMSHNDVEMRCQVLLSGDDQVLLDVPYKTYETLPFIDMPNNSEKGNTHGTRN